MSSERLLAAALHRHRSRPGDRADRPTGAGALVSASERLKALEERRWDSALPHHSAKREVSKTVLAALPQIVQVVEAVEAIQRNRKYLGDFPQLDAAVEALEEVLS